MTAEARPQRPLLAGNWKMNPVTLEAALSLADASTAAAERHQSVDVVVFAPFVWLREVGKSLARTALVGLGAQDCHWETSGAFTGEVSAAMLAPWCGWAIAGHSERRRLFGETDEMVGRKVAAALAAGLNVVACVGEGEEENQAGRTEEVVTAQVEAAIQACSADDSARLVLAYEPVWAIGTGSNADPEHAYRTMRVIRQVVAAGLGRGAGRRIRVLYGGSVNSDNVGSYVELPNCDGCLVGGASLDAEQFSAMVQVLAEVYGESA